MYELQPLSLTEKGDTVDLSIPDATSILEASFLFAPNQVNIQQYYFYLIHTIYPNLRVSENDMSAIVSGVTRDAVRRIKSGEHKVVENVRLEVTERAKDLQNFLSGSHRLSKRYNSEGIEEIMPNLVKFMIWNDVKYMKPEEDQSPFQPEKSIFCHFILGNNTSGIREFDGIFNHIYTFVERPKEQLVMLIGSGNVKHLENLINQYKTLLPHYLHEKPIIVSDTP